MAPTAAAHEGSEHLLAGVSGFCQASDAFYAPLHGINSEAVVMYMEGEVE